MHWVKCIINALKVILILNIKGIQMQANFKPIIKPWNWVSNGAKLAG